MIRGLVQRAETTPSARAREQVFTVICEGSAYGLPIEAVLTIFRTDKITPAPLAPPEILGLINLRGKIVTATSLRRILGLRDSGPFEDALAVCIEWRGEQFALIVDDVGDVVGISEAERIQDPPSGNGRGSIVSGAFHLETMILPVLDIEALFDFEARSAGVGEQREKGLV